MNLPPLNTITFNTNPCGMGNLRENGLYAKDFASIYFTTYVLTNITMWNALPMTGKDIDNINGIAHPDIDYNTNLTFIDLDAFIAWLNSFFNSVVNNYGLWKMQGPGLWYSNKPEHFQNMTMQFNDNGRIHDVVFDSTFD